GEPARGLVLREPLDPCAERLQGLVGGLGPQRGGVLADLLLHDPSPSSTCGPYRPDPGARPRASVPMSPAIPAGRRGPGLSATLPPVQARRGRPEWGHVRTVGPARGLHQPP